MAVQINVKVTAATRRYHCPRCEYASRCKAAQQEGPAILEISGHADRVTTLPCVLRLSEKTKEEHES